MPLRILHLGVGNFHRAHQAVYLQKLHERGDCGWTLVGGNLRPDGEAVIAALVAQQGQYTLETASPDGHRQHERIRALSMVVPFAPGVPALVALAADPDTRIVSFTVTEAGYYLDDRDRLALTHPDMVADLADAKTELAGRTLYGALTAMLRARQAQAAGPLTLLCCDNLRHNGHRFQRGLEQFITALQDWHLLEWMGRNTTCPDTMVDRITPRPPAELASRVAAATGFSDAAPVMSESFVQWVIEDRFAHGRPRWEDVGAELVADVQPFEEAKIRLLNATHSCLAWGGTLFGNRYIHESVALPVVRQWAHDYATEAAIPCLNTASSVRLLAQGGTTELVSSAATLDLPAYRDTVLARFGNAAIADTNQRVAMDGFAKLPGFIAPTVRDCLAAGRSLQAVAVLPALFLAFLQRWDAGTLPFPYEDQAMDAGAARHICRAADPVAAFCANRVLWNELAGDPRLEAAVREALFRARTALPA